MLALTLNQTKELYVTNRQNVLCLVEADLDYFTPCTHEEADTRMFLHTFDAASKQYDKIMICTVDTNVVVLAVANVSKLCVSELWILFNKDKKLRHLAIHENANTLGPQKALALPFFHVFTGCDHNRYLIKIWLCWSNLLFYSMIEQVQS